MNIHSSLNDWKQKWKATKQSAVQHPGGLIIMVTINLKENKDFPNLIYVHLFHLSSLWEYLLLFASLLLCFTSRVCFLWDTDTESRGGQPNSRRDSQHNSRLTISWVLVITLFHYTYFITCLQLLWWDSSNVKWNLPFECPQTKNEQLPLWLEQLWQVK